MFSDDSVNMPLLRRWSHNLRWAEVPEGVIPLTAADPDFPCAPAIREALSRYITDGQFSYGPAAGLRSFREALSKFYQERRKLAVPGDRILPTDSAAFGLELVCRAVLSPGDEVIIFDPVDFLFRHCTERNGGVAVSFPTPQGFRLEADALQQLITPRTRMICLCNPLNPTGKVFRADELRMIARIAVENNLLILSDEIWSDIIFAPHVYTSIASLDDEIARRTFTVTGFSKSYGLAALRIGAVLCPDDDWYTKILECSRHSFTVHGVNTVGQVAAQAALEGGQAWLDEFLQHLTRMRDLTVAGLNAIPGFSCIPPEGCYLAFADIRQTGKSSEAVHRLLMEEAKVAVVPGLPKWFGQGADGYIRISFATSESILKEALDRISRQFTF